jgi:hemerythrin-like domain-containing protein
MQIYQALQNDHRKVEKLLEQLVRLNANNSENRSDLIQQIRDELIPHSRAEECVFYNSLREIDLAKDTVMHGYQEHMEAETLLRLLQIRDSIDTEWKATANKLKDAIEHHIEEEEGKIFSIARQLFTDEEATMMAEAFEKLKPEIKIEGVLNTTIDFVMNLMPPRIASSYRTKGLDAKVEKSMNRPNP